MQTIYKRNDFMMICLLSEKNENSVFFKHFIFIGKYVNIFR